VADAERLPFRDRSFDLVYVHDGLHHLERPEAALAEMTRVARRAVSVTEPARAAATALAMRLGMAQDQEEAGNRVRRLTLDEVVAGLRSHGFEVVAAERYAMLYRHEPGRPTRALSSRPLFALAKVGLTAFNLVGGRIGNKLTVQAVRA
jgi:ubiquinone/menaquinone biosynthesis C-methylase UbiE